MSPPIGLGLGLSPSGLGTAQLPAPPTGYVYITDIDGAYIIDTDGAYLVELA